MYEYLSGQLIEKTPTTAVLDAHGIGYHVTIPLSSYERLPGPGETVRLFIHFVVREDAHALFGFLTEEERKLFRLLISVSGIGPRTAVTALSGIPVIELKKAIVQGSLVTLQSIPGIGRKTAERMVVELREKLVLDSQRQGAEISSHSEEQRVLIEDCMQALVSLGYRKQNAKTAIQKALKGNGAEKISVEDLIRASLRHV